MWDLGISQQIQTFIIHITEVTLQIQLENNTKIT